MFTTRNQLIKKSGNKGVDRFEYLQELVNEFRQSTSLGVLLEKIKLRYSEYKAIKYILYIYLESQEQVLANLANFAYDPLNYHYLRELKVIETFVEGLDSVNPYFKLYCIKGLCNLSNDPLNQEIIIRIDGIGAIKKLLKSENCELCIAAVTSLIFLGKPNFLPGMTTELLQFLMFRKFIFMFLIFI